MRCSLLLLALLYALPLFSQSDITAEVPAAFTSGDITLTLIDPASEDIPEDVEYVTPNGPSSKYFADQTEVFLVDFPTISAETAEAADSVIVTVAGNKFLLPQLQPFMVKGLEPGTANISVRLVNAVGEDIQLPAGGNKISFKYIEHTPLFTNEAVVLGILLLVLAFIFVTSSSSNPFWSKFYKYVPSLLLCYFIPAILHSLRIISGDYSDLYFIASRFLLPASLILLTLSIDLKGIIRLGPKAVIMFLAGTVGIMIGGPIAIFAISAIDPSIVGGAGPDAVWRGLATVAGSWIGGGANQTAMKEVFGASDTLFSAMIFVDVMVANIWMAFLLYGAGVAPKLDKLFKADTSAIEDLKMRMEDYQMRVAKIPSTTDLMKILAVAFGITAIAHFGADTIAPWIERTAPGLARFSLTSGFFWIIVIATTLGMGLSFTKARNLEGVGASKMGSVFLYVLVATIGMKMDLFAIFDNPGLFAVGLVWMLVHVIILLGVAKIIKAPFFFTAVGSQANVGGAASAPIVASAFHPSLATVGVLLAVLGYALGTYGAYICALLMQAAAPGL